MAKRRKSTEIIVPQAGGYPELVAGISELLERARRTAARTVNSILTATYWEIGRRIVEYEQGGLARAEYGAELWKRLAADLTAKYGRGFSKSNLASMRCFYLGWDIFQTPSGKFEAWAAMGGIKANVFASHYLTTLPDPETLRQEILMTQHALETRAAMKGPDHG